MMLKTGIKVTLFFITFNQRNEAIRTLKDAINQDYPNELVHIVVLNDGSTDGTFDALLDASSSIRHRCSILDEPHESHYRSAALWNKCIAAAPLDSDLFVQVDDVLLRRDFIRRHVEWHLHDPNFIITGAKFEGPEERWDLSSCARRSLAGTDGAPAFDIPATAVWGASMSYGRKLMTSACFLESERPYDERMTGYGHHEVEFALRMQKAGGRTVYDPSVGVFHRDHQIHLEFQRGLDREAIRANDLKQNAEYICSKHGLTALPRW